LTFDQFKLPDNARLSMFKRDFSHLIGAVGAGGDGLLVG
jgi:hypothetical protein